ncbi:MAG: Fic family protein [Candidatus Protochlamydia sp.]|nr:Fic family protein [Candidatus Protochlamydia sp.]
MFLPTSFEKNTFDRMMQFLNESNQIEGIIEIDYHKQKEFQVVGKGHFEALINSQQMAENCEPLTVGKIKSWQGLLTREQLSCGHIIDENEIGHIRSHSLQKNVRIGSHIPPDFSAVPTLLDHLVEQINEGLKDQKKLSDDTEFCKFLGSSFQKFESIHPFADGNGRTGRLLANYIATFCKRPIIVFSSEMKEKNEYYAAHKSEKAMGYYMAKKIQETIFGFNGQILFRDKNFGTTTKYQSADGKYQESYEHHALTHFLAEENLKDEKI